MSWNGQPTLERLDRARRMARLWEDDDTEVGDRVRQELADAEAAHRACLDGLNARSQVADNALLPEARSHG